MILEEDNFSAGSTIFGLFRAGYTQGVYIELDQGELRDMIQYSCYHRFATILYTVNIDSDYIRTITGFPSSIIFFSWGRGGG